MNIEPRLDSKLRLREQIASGEIEGIKYDVTQNIDRQAFFVEFHQNGKTTSVMFPIPLKDLVIEAYEFNSRLKTESKK